MKKDRHGKRWKSIDKWVLTKKSILARYRSSYEHGLGREEFWQEVKPTPSHE